MRFVTPHGAHALFVAACLLVPGWSAAEDFTLDWFATAAGGGDSRGGDFELSATLGQPEAGEMLGGDFAIRGGYWSIVAALATPAAPTLSVSLSAGELVIAWPDSGSEGFGLEETTALSESAAGTVWTWIGGTSGVSSGLRSVRLPLAAGNRFYRLHKP